MLHFWSTEDNKNLLVLPERRRGEEHRAHWGLAPVFHVEGSRVMGPKSRGPALGRRLAKAWVCWMGPHSRMARAWAVNPGHIFFTRTEAPMAQKFQFIREDAGLGTPGRTPYYVNFLLPPLAEQLRVLCLSQVSLAAFIYPPNFLLQSRTPPGKAKGIGWRLEGYFLHELWGLPRHAACLEACAR